MVHQALPDPGERVAHLDSEILEMPDGPDARTQKMGGRMNCPARENDLAGPHLLAPSLKVRGDTDAASAFEQQLACLRMGRDRQIAALTRRRVEIADRRGHPPFVGI